MSQHPRIYLDHAATTAMIPPACEGVAAGWRLWANPSSPHGEGRAAKAALEAARTRVAAAYDWPGETLFTSGASESLAIVMDRAVAGRTAVSAVEHDAVLRTAAGATVLPVLADGVLDMAALQAWLAAGDARPLVCIQWCNSETGVRQPLGPIAAIVHGAGGLLLVDAAQLPARHESAVAEHADFVALSAHKRGGPPGIGALLVRDFATLSPTGGQERGYRPGTENVPAILGYAAALDEPEDIARLVSLRARLDDAVVRSGGEVVAAGSARHPAIGSYRMPGTAATVQLIRLDMAGFAVSAGSACASGSMKPSHVLAALGWSEEAGREVIRISFGRTTTEAEVEAFVAAWRGVARATGRFAA